MTRVYGHTLADVRHGGLRRTFVTENRRALADTVKARRQQLRWSQRRLADEASCSHSTIKDIEAARPDRNYGADILGGISAAFGEDPSYLSEILHGALDEQSPMMRAFISALEPYLAPYRERLVAVERRLDRLEGRNDSAGDS
jgi:transcriptional regulator with XRE-family HTH domain